MGTKICELLWGRVLLLDIWIRQNIYIYMYARARVYVGEKNVASSLQDSSTDMNIHVIKQTGEANILIAVI